MYRQASTNAAGKPFDAAIIEAVWNKAKTSSDHPPLRVDEAGALIWKEGYGNLNSKFGWVIRHRRSVSSGGGDELENLEPLQWENSRRNGSV
jgi:hypothetical protein